MPMQDQAFQGFRGAEGTSSVRSKIAVDDEALIVGFWMYNQLNSERALSAFLESVKPLVYNSKTPGHIRASIAASYEQVEWFKTLRSWLHLLTSTDGHRSLDKFLAASLLKKCGWFSSEEEKTRSSLIRKQSANNYEWTTDIVKNEIYKVEDDSRLVTRAIATEAAGMGFSATTKATRNRPRKSTHRRGQAPDIDETKRFNLAK